VKDFDAMPIEFVRLLGEGEVKRLKKKEQIQALLSWQLNWITPEQVPLLRPSQIWSLQKEELIWALSPEQLVNIWDESLKHLKEEQIGKICDRSLIQRLSSNQVPQLRFWQWQYVRWSQSKAICAAFWVPFSALVTASHLLFLYGAYRGVRALPWPKDLSFLKPPYKIWQS